MRVLIVNTSEHTGGAAVAANRLMEALINNGIKTKMLVRDKQSDDISVADCGCKWQNKWYFLWERLVIFINNRLSRKNLFKVSIANTGIDITKTPEYQEADIIHFHWVNQGMISLQGLQNILKSGKPIVWTMHDMWPLTAICHHAYECERYQDSCGQCRFLSHPSRNDLSARVFRHKQKILSSAKSRITFVAVSNWLASKARSSALIGHLPINVIPNVISLRQFTLINRMDARTAVDVSEPYIIAFGAARIDDPIKGFSYFADALRLLTESGRFKESEIRVLLFGELRDTSLLNSLCVPYTYLGYIDDAYRQSQVYSASNVTVSSSAYETFGQTLIEAMACGCVPVSFDGSGQADIITHLENGYLAQRLSAESLADGIAWGLKSPISSQDLRRSVLRRYSESTIAQQYINLYNSLKK
jgi:glycosyltransferase involved in cell wall biosynthesis